MRLFGISILRSSTADALDEQARRTGYIAGRRGALINQGFRDWIDRAPDNTALIEVTRGDSYRIDRMYSTDIHPETNVCGLLWRPAPK